jgi:hypothetical protein
MRKLLNGALFGLMLTVAACDTSAPTLTGVASSEPRASGGGGSGGSGGGTTINFLTAAPGAPSVNSPIAFWAVQGQDRTAEVSYVSANGGNLSRKLLRLRLRSRTQIVRPDGTLLAPGDSLLITITVTNLSAGLAQFEPSGLRFTGKDPATLTMWYTEADHDFNHDGVINALDTNIEKQFAIYRQEAVGLPWIKVGSTVSTDIDQVQANIPGFTNYVIAY